MVDVVEHADIEIIPEIVRRMTSEAAVNTAAE